jgi:hypothetical protein
LKVAYGSRNYGDGDKGLAPLDIIFILDKFLKIDDCGGAIALLYYQHAITVNLATGGRDEEYRFAG